MSQTATADTIDAAQCAELRICTYGEFYARQAVALARTASAGQQVFTVGDVLVCLINYCALRDLDMTRCLAGAYEQIKDRRGTLMPDGTFVKEQP